MFATSKVNFHRKAVKTKWFHGVFKTRLFHGVFKTKSFSWCVQNQIVFTVCSKPNCFHGVFKTKLFSWCVQNQIVFTVCSKPNCLHSVLRTKSKSHSLVFITSRIVAFTIAACNKPFFILFTPLQSILSIVSAPKVALEGLCVSRCIVQKP